MPSNIMIHTRIQLYYETWSSSYVCHLRKRFWASAYSVILYYFLDLKMSIFILYKHTKNLRCYFESEVQCTTQHLRYLT